MSDICILRMVLFDECLELHAVISMFGELVVESLFPHKIDTQRDKKCKH